MLGDFGEQAEHSQPDDKAVGRRLRAQSERRLERITLWAGQSLPQLEHRCRQLMQPRVCELHLVLDTSRRHHATPGRTLHQVPQQCRLPDTRLAAHDQHLALPSPQVLQQSIQGAARTVPTVQHVPKIFGRHGFRRYIHGTALPIRRVFPPLVDSAVDPVHVVNRINRTVVPNRNHWLRHHTVGLTVCWFRTSRSHVSRHPGLMSRVIPE